MGRSGGVSLIAAMIVCASSRSVARDVEAEEAALLLPVDHRDDARAVRLSIARIAWLRLTANQRPMIRGCSAITAIKIQISVEKSRLIGGFPETE